MDPIGNQYLADLLDNLASKAPAPGGGAVASMTGASAAALAGMVVAYSLGKKSLAEHQGLLESTGARLARMRASFLSLADKDALAYAALNELQRLPPDDKRRLAEEPAAIRRAIDTPQEVLDLALELLGLVEQLVGKSNRHLRSDLAISAVLAEAAAASAGWNVRINTPLLPGDEQGSLLERLNSLLAKAQNIRKSVEQACN